MPISASLPTSEGRDHGTAGCFKKVKKYSSFMLKQAGWKYEGGNRIWTGGRWYKFSCSRPVAGSIKTVMVKRDKLGQL